MKKLKSWLLLGLVLVLFYFGVSEFRKSRWDGENNFNLVVGTERFFLYSYQPHDNQLYILSLPEDVSIQTAKGYGEYQLKNIVPLGRMEGFSGGEFLRMSLTQFFTIPQDGYLVGRAGKKANLSSQSLEKGQLSPIFWCLITRECETSLSLWDWWRLNNKVRKLKLNELNLINLEETPLLEKKTLPDGSQTAVVNTNLIDDFFQKYFTDPKILDEAAKISLLNATDFPGIAQNYSNLIKNMGGAIISSQDAQGEEEESMINIADSKQKTSYTVKKIGEILEIKKIVYKKDIRGDISIVLGKDFVKRFYTK